MYKNSLYTKYIQSIIKKTITYITVYITVYCTVYNTKTLCSFCINLLFVKFLLKIIRNYIRKWNKQKKSQTLIYNTIIFN